jgi:hypothetical protein
VTGSSDAVGVGAVGAGSVVSSSPLVRRGSGDAPTAEVSSTDPTREGVSTGSTREGVSMTMEPRAVVAATMGDPYPPVALSSSSSLRDAKPDGPRKERGSWKVGDVEGDAN